MDTGKVIGIDLGTTYSCAAVWQHERFEMIVNEQGNRNTPSMVAFTPLERLIGDAARNQVSTNRQNTVFDVKRLIGRRFNDHCVQTDMQHWPFTVVEGNNGQPIIQVDYKGDTECFTAEEISSMVLKKMKKIAEEFLNCEVKNAVISVPAYFNSSQRRATKDAAKVAGLSVMRIINEPTAAAIAYGFHTDVFSSNTKKTIVVFDLGGGTFDVSILNVHGGEFQVKAVGGDTRLGGEDFKNRLLSHCVQHFNTKHNKQLNSNARALWKLRLECESAKRTLSSALETVIAIDYLYEGIDFEMKITREKFEELNRELFEQTIQIVKGCLEDAKMSAEQIDDVVLAGGSTRIPMVQHLLEQLFPGKRLYKTINPDEIIAYGAAAFAAALNSEEVKLVVEDVTALSLGIQAVTGNALSLGIQAVTGNVMDVVVPRNTPLPITRMRNLVSTEIEPEPERQPNDGFAIVEDNMVWEPEPDVGFTTSKDNLVSEHEHGFITAKDNQVSVAFKVYEGQSDNNLVGEFLWAAGGVVPDIKGVFEVDEDGILKVRIAITINDDSDRLRRQEIERMLSDAEKFERDDEEATKRRVVKAKLTNYIYNMKNRRKEGKVKMDVNVAAGIDQMLDDAAESLGEDENLPGDELEKLLQSLTSKCVALE